MLRRLFFNRRVPVHRGGVSQHALQQVFGGVYPACIEQEVSQHALQQVSGGGVSQYAPIQAHTQGGNFLLDQVQAHTPRGKVEGDQVQAHTQGGNGGRMQWRLLTVI